MMVLYPHNDFNYGFNNSLIGDETDSQLQVTYLRCFWGIRNTKNQLKLQRLNGATVSEQHRRQALL